MYPVWRKYSFCSLFRPVTFTFDALMTMTPSPVSMCGVKIGLCLPRMIFATSDAKRPSTWSSASTTYQRLVMSRGVAENVFIGGYETEMVLRLTGAGCNPGLGRPRAFLTDPQATRNCGW